MTYNEVDIIREVMDNNLKYFDKILVLDGSSDGTTEIISEYVNVVYLIHDRDIFPKRKITDGARQFLLEKAQEMYPIEGWFTILCGDEIFVDNPNDIARRAEKKGAEIVNWHALNFFLHTSQKNQKINLTKPLQDQIRYYSPGGLEVRQFKNKPDIFFDINTYKKVYPEGIRAKTLLDYPIYKHYVIRGPQQFQFKKRTGTQVVRESDEKQQIYFDNYYSDGKKTFYFDGSFGDLTPGKRPIFIIQYLNWHKYRKINWGFLTPIVNKLKMIMNVADS